MCKKTRGGKTKDIRDHVFSPFEPESVVPWRTADNGPEDGQEFFRQRRIGLREGGLEALVQKRNRLLMQRNRTPLKERRT